MRFWLGIFVLAVFLNAILGAHAWPAVLAGELNDPDSYMRLERILQGIHQGRLINIVARDDSGAGVLVEWSRLLDALIWAMALPFAPFIGWQPALFVAGVMLGPVSVGFLAVTIVFVAEPLAARQFLWAGALSAALLPGIATFAVPGVVHYHVLLLAFIALTVGFVIRAWNGETLHGFLAGICGGFAIWLTPETMPFVLMAFAALLLRWCNLKIGSSIAACAAGFVDVLIFGLTIDPPEGGYGVMEIDRLSAVYVILGILLLCGGLWLWRMDRWKHFRFSRGAGALLMAGLIIAWVAAFPKVAMGPYGVMSKADMQRFFGVMTELQPLRGIADVKAFLLPGILAFFYVLFRAFKASAWQPRLLWLYLAVCTFVSLVLADKFILFVGFAASITAALLPIAMSDFSFRFEAKPIKAMQARIYCLVAILLLPLLPWTPPVAANAASASPVTSCDLHNIDSMLSPIGRAVVLAPADETPELLYRTDVKTVGSLYQHGVPGFLRLRDAWRVIPGNSEPDTIKITSASYVLFCNGLGRTLLVADLPPTSLWDDLLNGHVPPWLQIVSDDKSTGWRLYKIIQ